MKKLFTILLAILLLPSILAISLSVEKQSSNEVMIMGLDKPVVFDLKIKNNGLADSFEFYNLLGFKMFPVGTTFIGGGQTKEVKLEIYPIGDFDYKGAYSFNYFIRGQDSSEIEEEITFKIVELGGAFEIGSGEVDPESNSIQIYIHNKVSFDFGEINAKFKSVFFDFEETFSIGPNERKDFDVELNKDDFKKLMAGFYTLNVEVTIDDKKADIEGIIKFVEKDVVTTTQEDYGFIINTQIIKKKNEGNVLVESETALKKNILSRLFTTFNPEPNNVEREGSTIYYAWKNEIKPGETLEIVVKTNWLFPLLVILFIVAIVVLAKQYSKTNLVLKKKVNFVNAKGGEFALKVSILVHAKKYIERANIIDRLPMMVKVHEKFLGEEPTRVNEKNRRIEWNFEKLEEGETRVLSYIIYSKIGILGKFALPSATAIYERNGDIQEAESNKAFFIAEQRKSEIED